MIGVGCIGGIDWDDSGSDSGEAEVFGSGACSTEVCDWGVVRVCLCRDTVIYVVRFRCEWSGYIQE